MAEPNTVTIGGEVIPLPKIATFEQLERIWPAMTAMDAADGDPIRKTAARLALIAGVLLETRPDLTLPVLKKRLRINLFDGSDETTGLVLPVQAFLVASGLAKPGDAQGDGGPGEAGPLEAPAETAPQTSNTSSPS